MDSLVLTIQQEAIDTKVSVSELLKKTYVLSKKLKLEDISKWIELELDGYDEYDEDIPEYRVVQGQIEAFNPYHGWTGVIITNNKTKEYITKCPIIQSIHEIEDLYKRSEGSFVIDRTNEMLKLLKITTNSRLKCDSSVLKKILESVRKIILDWSLKLEEDGILGEGILFTEKEKEIAREENYTINISGNHHNVQIQNKSNNSSQNIDIESVDLMKVEELLKIIRENLESIKLDINNEEIIKEQMKKIEAEIKQDKPKNSFIKKSFLTIKNVLEGVTGSIIASGIIHNLGLFISG
ncbi:MAG: hypothetical protein KBA47_02990 [Caldisericia bacterium]|nr:hypothetical protein [Caldisericia bacterium]